MNNTTDTTAAATMTKYGKTKLNATIREYIGVNGTKNELTKKAKELSSTIKSEMAAAGLTEYNGPDFKAVISSKMKRVLDMEKLTKILTPAQVEKLEACYVLKPEFSLNVKVA